MVLPIHMDVMMSLNLILISFIDAYVFQQGVNGCTKLAMNLDIIRRRIRSGKYLAQIFLSSTISKCVLTFLIACELKQSET
jgi:hypothetical protein